MAKRFYIGVDNVARTVIKGYVGVDNVARGIAVGYIGVDDVARQTFAATQLRTYKLKDSVLKDDLSKFRNSTVDAEGLTVVFKDGTEVNPYLFEAVYEVHEYTTDDGKEISEHTVFFDVYVGDSDEDTYVEQYYDIDDSQYMMNYRESNSVDKIILTMPIDTYNEYFMEFLNVIAEEVETTN